MLRRCGLLFLCLLLQGCGARKEHTHLIPVRLVVGLGIAFLPVHLAHQLGFYQQEGLAVTLEDAPSTTKTTQALLGGSADVAGGLYE